MPVFSARLSHYSNRFAMNTEYLFFAQFIKKQEKESDSINIAVTKVHGLSLTASNLRSSVQSLYNLLRQDQAYLFLRQIPGTPPYWKTFVCRVVAMVNQLRILTWFVASSWANSCFIYNYFVAGIKDFRTNVDLQPVFNNYKCVTYVCSYFTGDGLKCSQAIVNAAKEA